MTGKASLDYLGLCHLSAHDASGVAVSIEGEQLRRRGTTGPRGWKSGLGAPSQIREEARKSQDGRATKEPPEGAVPKESSKGTATGQSPTWFCPH